MFNQLIILTEAGAEIGFGHFTRCSAIYKAATEKKINCKLFVFENKVNLNDPNLISNNWLHDLSVVLNESKNSLVLIDSYIAQNIHYKTLKKHFSSVIAIDDYNRIVYEADLLINPNVFYESINYSNQSADCRGGKDFVILREVFRECNNELIIPKQLNHLLVSLGGSDFRNLISPLIAISLKSGINKISVISPQEIINYIPNNNVEVFPTQSAEEMLNLFISSNIVISGCGQTLHELAHLGKPTIGICLDIDQEPNRDFYLKKGFLSAKINWNDKNFEKNILTEIEGLKNIDKRKTIAKIAPNLINKNGVYNIIDLIQRYDQFQK